MNPWLFAVAFVVPVAVLGAQDAGDRLAFEVASVRPSPPGDGRTSLTSTLGRLVATRATLRSLVSDAYELMAFQVEGGPRWINQIEFDIAARAAQGGPPDQQMAMLQTLLSERFDLVAHFETREGNVFALVDADDDGRPRGRARAREKRLRGRPAGAPVRLWWARRTAGREHGLPGEISRWAGD